MADHSSLFFNLVIVLGSATIVATAFHLLRFPPMVGFLFAGILIGPHGFKLVSSLGEVELLAEVGAVLLLFTVGLEFSWKKVFSLRKLLLNLGLSQVALTAFVVTLLCQWMWDFQFHRALFAGLLVAMSSTAAVLKLLHDNRHTETPFGKASLGILISQDLSVIVVLVLLPLISPTTSGIDFFTWNEMITVVAKAILVVAIVSFGTRYFVPRFLDVVSQTGSREVFFFSILFVCSLIAILMQQLGLSLSLGAFCAGVMISESPYGRQTMSDFTPLRDNFLGIFFVAIGMLLNLGFVREHLLTILALLLAILVLKSGLVVFVMWLFGNPASLGVSTGLILSQVGEFSFILVDQGKRLGLVDEHGRQLFLALAISSLALAPALYRLAMKVAFRFNYGEIIPLNLQKLALSIRESIIRDPLKVRLHETNLNLSSLEQLEDHVVIIGYGIAAQEVAQALKALEVPYRILEMNQRTVKRYSKQEPIYYGDATQRMTLESMQLAQARLAIIAVTGAEIAGAIHRSIRQVTATLPVLIRAQYLRDLRVIEDHPKTHLVIAEFEGTLGLIDESLKVFGVNSETRESFIDLSRRNLEAHHRESRSAATK